MTQTKNLGLNKPDGTDFYDVGDFNTNADIIDRAIGDMSKELEGKADTDHTHTPGSIGAATSDQGAKADSAVQTIKINGAVQTKSAGVVDLPAYPAKLPADGGNADTVNGHSVNSDVPANAKFTDTVYTHPTSAGNKHIPAGGSAGQILRWSAAGTAVWGADNNTTYGNMKGATTSAAGAAGLVPAPAAGAATRYLRSDGTWQVPPDTNTTYGAASASANGLMTTGAQTFAGNKTFNGQVLPAGANAYGTPQARKLSSGTAAAATANCPAGAWYGQHG